MGMESVLSAILERAREAEEGLLSIDGPSLAEISHHFGISPREAEIAALEAGVVPIRYLRNMGVLGLEGQWRLLRSCVGICGLGGLGGFVVELLARLGIGRLVLVDGDVFTEHNLNRQFLCTQESLGAYKVEVSVKRVREVNPSVEVTAYRLFFQGQEDIFRGTDVVVDALDHIPPRLALQNHCAALGIPLVHGAIAGLSGQVMTVFPGDRGLAALYPPGAERGVEQEMGNPAFTPAVVASLQAAEVVKVLCGKGEPVRNGFLFVDLEEGRFEFIPLKD